MPLCAFFMLVYVHIYEYMWGMCVCICIYTCKIAAYGRLQISKPQSSLTEKKLLLKF